MVFIKRTVTQTKIDGKYQIIEQDSAKTKSSLRTLLLVGSFKENFTEVKKAQELNKKICGNCYSYEYDGYVFVDELGERMKPDYLTSYFPEYIQRHGMKKMRFHDLRHSCASLLLANGVPLKQIQEWLGHSDFSTTANIYAHLDYTSKIFSAQAMEKGMVLPSSNGFESRWSSVTETDETEDGSNKSENGYKRQFYPNFSEFYLEKSMSFGFFTKKSGRRGRLTSVLPHHRSCGSASGGSVAD